VTDGDDWESARMAVIHGEARAVLDAQNATIADIDGKAIKTVRFNAILIGLLLTGERIAGPGVFHPQILHFALASLVCSTVVGIATYNESNLYLGPGGRYFEFAVEHTAADERWDADLVEGFAGMILENDETLQWNASLLAITQATLILGIVGAVVATAI
jgi:hypothetical protein